MRGRSSTSTRQLLELVGEAYGFEDLDAFRPGILELYRECYRLLGVESQIAFTLPARPPMVLGIALSRGEEDFSDAEAKLLGLARPYLIQAYRNAELSSHRR
jgi:hypothetical protein